MTKPIEGIGQRVRQARERLHISQAELARRVEASAYGMNLLEQGVTKHPRVDRLAAIADVLEVSLDYLTGREKGRKTEISATKG